MVALIMSPQLQTSIARTLATTLVIAALFGFIGQRRRHSAYDLWAVGWLFYALFVGVMLLADLMAQDWHLATIASGGVALSALFMIAGNLEMADRPVKRWRLAVIAVVVVALNYLAHEMGAAYWFACPAVWTLALAALSCGFMFYRGRQPNVSVVLVVSGYVGWAALVVASPVVQSSPLLFDLNEFASTVCLLAIGLGVLVDRHVEKVDQKYRMVLDASYEAIFLVDLVSLRIVDANQAAVRLTRRDLSDLTGRSFLNLCPELHEKGTTILDHRTMFASVIRPFNEFQFQRADGMTVVCEGDTALCQWNNRALVYVRIREMNADDSTSQLMRRAEKMSSLGQLIAGVAHELNNPLAVVVGYAQLMGKHPQANDELRAGMGRVLREAERAAKIVRDLLAFARPCEPQLAAANLNQLVNEVVNTRRSDLEANGITVDLQLDPGLRRTKVDPSQIEQVLNNLVTNAVHAMQGNTRPSVLTITTREHNGNIHVAVADTGAGIPTEILQKIFEPFFTTKAIGKGTGLGLSISHNILKEHRGRIWAESFPGQGATLHLTLPVVECEEPVVPSVTPEAKAAASGENRMHHLLVVDDEPGIREVLAAILTGQGYEVMTATNGVEALSFVREQNFDLIVTDLFMPEMDGEKLYETVRGIAPALARRMIFVTGDTVSVKTRSFLDRTGCQWISKPFNISDIESIVARHLKGASPKDRQPAEKT